MAELKSTFKVRWPDVFALLGLSLSFLMLVAAMFYGYDL